MICVIYLEMQAKNMTFREEREYEYTEMNAVEHRTPDSRLCERYQEKTWYRTTISHQYIKMGHRVGEVLELTFLNRIQSDVALGVEGGPKRTWLVHGQSCTNSAACPLNGQGWWKGAGRRPAESSGAGSPPVGARTFVHQHCRWAKGTAP